ncbi:MAG TPA: prohibitin family protein [Chryseolinea sp.]
METEVKFGKIIFDIALGLIAIIFFFGSFGVIRAGDVGVRTTLGQVKGVQQPGLYFKIPFIQKVHKISVRTQTVNYDQNGEEGDSRDTSELAAASKDLQDVEVAVVVNYHVDPAKAIEVYVQYKDTDAFDENVVQPIIREVVKSNSAQYTAEELVTKRAEYSDKVSKALVTSLSEKGAVVEKGSITNLEFSQAFTQAIEAKVTAVQNAEAAKNKLVQVQFEAQQQIEKAKAEAETIRIQAQAITQQGGKDYVQLKALEKWDGKLPQQFVPGSAIPFINLNQ